MKVVTGKVIVSDQYGRSVSTLLGVFTDDAIMKLAIERFQIKFATYRTHVIVTEVVLNQVKTVEI